nr:hypothetical protein [Tanacetum cinerariifolium]
MQKWGSRKWLKKSEEESSWTTVYTRRKKQIEQRPPLSVRSSRSSSPTKPTTPCSSLSALAGESLRMNVGLDRGIKTSSTGRERIGESVTEMKAGVRHTLRASFHPTGFRKRLDSLSDHPILKDSLLALTLLPFEYPFLLLHASSPINCLTLAFIPVTDSHILSLPVELVLIPLSRPTFILRLSPARAEREEQGVLSNYFLPPTSLATSSFPTSASVVFGRACFVAEHLAMLAAWKESGNRPQVKTFSKVEPDSIPSPVRHLLSCTS